MDEVFDIYIGMWRWIRENLSELKSSRHSIHTAKEEYLTKQHSVKPRILDVFAYCMLCEVYRTCQHCPLKACLEYGSPFSMVSHFFRDSLYHGKPVTLTMAQENCNKIIIAHEELGEHPVDALFDRLREAGV